ncbi:MAG: hypothetical protein R3C56_34485 [Pirellulaceae bacterium]
MTRAGTLIFCTAVLVWAAGYFPGDHRPLNELTRKIEQAQAQAAKSAEADASTEKSLDGLPLDGLPPGSIDRPAAAAQWPAY